MTDGRLRKRFEPREGETRKSGRQGRLTYLVRRGRAILNGGLKDPPETRSPSELDIVVRKGERILGQGHPTFILMVTQQTKGVLLFGVTLFLKQTKRITR